MINIGKINTLRVVAQYPFGYALAPLVENNDENNLATTTTTPKNNKNNEKTLPKVPKTVRKGMTI